MRARNSWRVSALLLAAAASASCSEPEHEASLGASAPPPPTLSSVASHARKPDEPLLFPGVGLDHAALRRTLAEAPPLHIRPVGKDRLLLSVKLAGPVDALFCPETADAPDAPRNEETAYRIAELLRLDNVPPVVSRSFSAAVLEASLEPSYADAWPLIRDRVAWDRTNRAAGVMIYRAREMRALHPSTTDLRWLRQGTLVPPIARRLAGDMAAGIFFRYLLGIGGEWSPPFHGLPSQHRLILDGYGEAFFEAAEHPAMRKSLERVERVSESFARTLLTVDDSDLAHALEGRIAAGQIRAVLDRRRALGSYVGTLVDAYGRQRALPFP